LAGNFTPKYTDKFFLLVGLGEGKGCVLFGQEKLREAMQFCSDKACCGVALAKPGRPSGKSLL